MTLLYLNGDYLPPSQAHLSPLDRGVLFGDGVYEVIRIYGGVPFELDAHAARLTDSLRGIRLDVPGVAEQLSQVTHELIRRTGLHDAKVYWQVTRGPADHRDHAFPTPIHPTVLATIDPLPPLRPPLRPPLAPPLGPDEPLPSVTAITRPDERWSQCWIKSLMLLPNVLAKQAARDAGCDEAILHRGGVVTEGSSTSVLMVRKGRLETHPLDGSILPSVTRRVVLDLARAMVLEVREQAVTLSDLHHADEVMIVGTTTQIAAVTRLDGRLVGNGRPGRVTRQLHEAFVASVDTLGLPPHEPGSEP